MIFDGSAIQGGSYSMEKKMSENPGDNTYEFRVRSIEPFNNDPYANFYTEFPMAITFDGKDKIMLSQADITDGFNYHFVRE